ncbi:C-type mannose receptor 2-like [Melanotaenia boesemani]|uniref:C-type mannose receptor 2-like n=1 Tax=Melanotaenia boesemani TaxID=1250792 RepID=UPI001C04C93C|nr:C-type mannose receptor 2-like [Melanotaenia boesemani]
MEKVLLFICAASALCVVLSLPTRQYHFVNDLKNWTEARSYCREKYSDLATIDNMEDVELLNKITKSNMMSAWIGLYDDWNSWRWSMSNADFYKDGEAGFRNWGTDPINTYGLKECCTRMGTNGLWFDAPCEFKHRLVCVNISGQNVSFVGINEIRTWTEAQSYCRENYTDLASVRNMAENQKVTNLFPGQYVWIGLFRDSWKWVDGRNRSFTYWVEDQPYGPDQQCVVSNFADSGKWEDRYCNLMMPFICESV